MSVRLSLVIGALREEKRLGKTLKELHSYLETSELLDNTEVIIVIADGGDNTAGIALKHQPSFPKFKIIEPGEPVGKGRDIRIGMQAASGSTQLFMDADLATPLHHIEDALQLIEHKATDIVIGVRDIRKMHHSKRRFAISLIGNLCFSVVSGRYLPDTQCGFKAFSKKASGACFSRLTRDNWSFDMELMVIAFQNGLTIAQLPIYDWKDVPGGTFKGYLGNSLQFLKDLGMIFYNRIASRYS